uniref:Uncharacterized protein n=1 Tax=Amphimedon queenslandica TaxID=400682 RepID=A0A1X7TN02_AMPQE
MIKLVCLEEDFPIDSYLHIISCSWDYAASWKITIKMNKSGRLNGSPSAVRKGISFRRKNKYDIKRKDKGKRVSTVSEHYDLYSDR